MCVYFWGVENRTQQYFNWGSNGTPAGVGNPIKLALKMHHVAEFTSDQIIVGLSLVHFYYDLFPSHHPNNPCSAQALRLSAVLEPER